MDADDYEIFVRRSGRRRRTVLLTILGGLVVLLYLPWALVSAHFLSSNVAEIVSVFDGLLLFAAWHALLIRLLDAADLPEVKERSEKSERTLIWTIVGGLVASIVLCAMVSYVFGFIGPSGIAFTAGLLIALGAWLLRRLFWHSVTRGIL